MFLCGTPDKNGALHSSFDYKTLKMISTEVISQQRGRRTGYTNSFLLQNDVVVCTESIESLVDVYRTNTTSVVCLSTRALISQVQKMG